MSGHLSAQRIEHYHQGKLAPAELLTVGDHLASCAACREQMGGGDQILKAYTALGPDLGTRADNEPAHIPPEQMAAYVDNRLDEVDRSIAESHLDYCVDCHTELLDLRRFKTSLPVDDAEAPASMAAPVRSKILAPLWRSPAQWLPVSAAALLVLLLAGLGLIALRKQVTSLREQLSDLQKRNDALEDSISSLSAAQQQTQGDRSFSDEPMIVVLNDSGRLVTLDKEGSLAGLTTLSQAYEQMVKTVLTEQRVKASPLLAELVGRQGVIMGPGPERGSFSLRSPVGTIIESDRPTFRWSPLSGTSVSYAVTVLNTTSKEVIASGSLAATEWTPPQALERGIIYAWEVTATRDGKESTQPAPPAPQARFRVLPQAKVDELNRARQMYPGSHLLPGILYAQAGLLDQAEREFEALAAANPDSLTAQKLLRSVKTHTNQ